MTEEFLTGRIVESVSGISRGSAEGATFLFRMKFCQMASSSGAVGRLPAALLKSGAATWTI